MVGASTPGIAAPGTRTNSFFERATRRVKLGLILAELIRKHELSAKPEQVKAMVQEFAQSYEHPEEVVRWYNADPSRMREVENLVLEDNVVDWVLAGARVNDKTATLTELMGSN